MTAFLPDVAVCSDPFPLTLQKQLREEGEEEEEEEEGVGVGPGGLMNTLSVLFVHVFNSILQKKEN